MDSDSLSHCQPYIQGKNLVPVLPSPAFCTLSTFLHFVYSIVYIYAYLLAKYTGCNSKCSELRVQIPFYFTLHNFTYKSCVLIQLISIKHFLYMRHYYKQFLYMSEQNKQNLLILQSLYPSRNANI